MNIRKPAVAGQFYSDQPEKLEKVVADFLKGATAVKDSHLVKAIIVPHAGYLFSGEVAAYGYKAFEGKKPKNIFLLGNAHQAFFSGVAVDGSDAWETPLGNIFLNKDIVSKLDRENDFINMDSSVFSSDHNLEVQAPFLQVLFNDEIRIIPILFGANQKDMSREMAKALSSVMGKDDLVVVSSDMSHYPSYEDAYRIDQKSLEIIEKLDQEGLDKHIIDTMSQKIPGEETLMCGLDAVKTIMEISLMKEWQKVEVLKYATSGDMGYGEKEKVVGYGAVAFGEESSEDLSDEQREILLNIAKKTIDEFVQHQKIPDFHIKSERLQELQGAFVTIRKNGQLRGCIGQILPGKEQLWEVVRDMAVAAASDDPRFEPLTAEELEEIEVEVSVLSVPRQINDWQTIELGKHGVIVKKGTRSGVFLPQVAEETAWDLEEFLGQLCWQKAGLPPDAFKNDKDLILQVFTAQVFAE